MPKAVTRSRLLRAARDLVASGQGGSLPSAGAVAARAGVSRLTVYDHFGSHAGLLAALAQSSQAPPAAAPQGDSRTRLRQALAAACEHWASDPALFRRLPPAADASADAQAHDLATALAEEDRLRPGTSLREAEDVIALVLSFQAFDRLHRDGRRSPAAVSEILHRLASAVLT